MTADEFIAPKAWGFSPRHNQFLRVLLMAPADRTLKKTEMLDAIYPDDYPEAKIVDVFACHVRKKLARVFGADIVIIETVWGQGYRISDGMREQILARAAGEAWPTTQEIAA